MSNRVAFLLAIVILAAIAYDAMRNDASNLLFLAKKFAEFLEWIAFWR